MTDHLTENARLRAALLAWEAAFLTGRNEPLQIAYENGRNALATPAPDAPDLTDPVVVHANMLRGTIAKPTVAQIIPMGNDIEAYNAFRGSLDAAKALHEALLPGWFPGMSQNTHHGHWYAWVQDKATAHFSAEDNDPARAWLLAILRAKAEAQLRAVRAALSSNPLGDGNAAETDAKPQEKGK